MILFSFFLFSFFLCASAQSCKKKWKYCNNFEVTCICSSIWWDDRFQFLLIFQASTALQPFSHYSGLSFGVWQKLPLVDCRMVLERAQWTTSPQVSNPCAPPKWRNFYVCNQPCYVQAENDVYCEHGKTFVQVPWEWMIAWTWPYHLFATLSSQCHGLLFYLKYILLSEVI